MGNEETNNIVLTAPLCRYDSQETPFSEGSVVECLSALDGVVDATIQHIKLHVPVLRVRVERDRATDERLQILRKTMVTLLQLEGQRRATPQEARVYGITRDLGVLVGLVAQRIVTTTEEREERRGLYRLERNRRKILDDCPGMDGHEFTSSNIGGTGIGRGTFVFSSDDGVLVRFQFFLGGKKDVENQGGVLLDTSTGHVTFADIDSECNAYLKKISGNNAVLIADELIRHLHLSRALFCKFGKTI